MSRKVEITVGLFMVIVICSILFLCFRVTDATTFTNNSTYRVYAVFDNIGGLKARSPIKIGGVVIGRVADISLVPYSPTNSDSFKPYVTMDIGSQYDHIPSSSSLSIKTSGLLGEQFLDVALGIDNSVINDIDAADALDSGIESQEAVVKIPPYFQENFVVHNTKSALVLEDLIGQIVYSLGSGSQDSKDSKANSSENTNQPAKTEN